VAVWLSLFRAGIRAGEFRSGAGENGAADRSAGGAGALVAAGGVDRRHDAGRVTHGAVRQWFPVIARSAATRQPSGVLCRPSCRRNGPVRLVYCS
jgi:hypothetical protein